MISVIYLLKVIDLLNRRKKIKKKVNHCQKKTIAERVKLRRQKADDDISPPDGDDSVEFIDIPEMPLLEGDEEEVKKGKGLKILTPNKLLTRLPILLAQMKVRNNSNKLKNKIRQILYLLYQHNKITRNV